MFEFFGSHPYITGAMVLGMYAVAVLFIVRFVGFNQLDKG